MRNSLLFVSRRSARSFLLITNYNLGTASYRLMPEIRLKEPIYDEDAEQLQKCFTQGVIDLELDEQGNSLIDSLWNGWRNLFSSRRVQKRTRTDWSCQTYAFAILIGRDKMSNSLLLFCREQSCHWRQSSRVFSVFADQFDSLNCEAEVNMSDPGQHRMNRS